MKAVIIFGTSKAADKVFPVVENLPGYKLVAFTDNNSEKWGTQKNEVPIIPVYELVERDVKIIIASQYIKEIAEQLSEMGIKDYCENIYGLIGCLEKEDRILLKERLHNQNIKINLDYDFSKLNLEHDSLEKDCLVVCNGGYPSPENPAPCAFIHRRLLQYQKENITLDVYSATEDGVCDQYRYEDVNVYKGEILGLLEVLKRKKYKKILIHFVNSQIIYVLKKAGVYNLPIIIWCHGYEVENWTNRYFNYTEEQIENNRIINNKYDKEKVKLFEELFSKENIQIIFVSEWLKERVYENIGILPLHYAVIHNFIDDNLYIYYKKEAEDRKKILSIKSHNTRTYANDIVAKAILELSQKEFFKELTFELCGEGSLFESNFSELIKADFPNVIIRRAYLSQKEIAEKFTQYGIFLSPTRTDTQNVSNGEAMSTGMTVISCRTAAIPEFIDNDCGCLYEFDNYFQMADQIEFLYYHPEEFLLRCKNAVMRVREQCGYDATIKKEIELIKEK